MRKSFAAAICALKRTASSSAEATPEICRTVDTAACNQLFAMALAIGDKKDKKKEGPVLRADAAETYQDFAGHLSLIAPQAHGNLRSALTEWATGSTVVARYVAEKKPRAGLVIDYGPTERRWDAAQKAAEKVWEARPSRPRSLMLIELLPSAGAVAAEQLFPGPA